MKPISSKIEEYKKSSLLRAQKKIVKKLTDEEFQTLMRFAISQNTSFCFLADKTHKARLLERKGLISTGYGRPYGDGSETFFITKNLLNFLTEEYQELVDEFRTGRA